MFYDRHVVDHLATHTSLSVNKKDVQVTKKHRIEVFLYVYFGCFSETSSVLHVATMDKL